MGDIEKCTGYQVLGKYQYMLTNQPGYDWTPVFLFHQINKTSAYIFVTQLLLVQREVSNLHIDCTFPDTSMPLSGCVLQTFLDKKSILANAIVFHFQDGYFDFKMAVKVIII